MSYDDIDNMLDELEDLDPDEREDAIQEIRDKIEEQDNNNFYKGVYFGRAFGQDD